MQGSRRLTRLRRRPSLPRLILVAAVVGGLFGSIGCQQVKVPKPPPFTVEEKPWAYGRAEGKLLITPHYEIFTTARDEAFVSVLPNFVETAHQLYMRLLPITDPTQQRSNLYVFGGRNEWEAFTRQFAPERANTYMRIRSGGYAEPKGTVVYLLRQRYQTLAVVAHECMHMYIFRNCPPKSVPPWLNEGLACYCEGHDWQDHTPVFTPGTNRFRMNSVRRALIKNNLFKIQEMLATNAGNVLRFSPDRVAVYYAQAWSMVAFLMHGGRYSEGFARLREELGTERMRLTVNGYLASNPGRGGAMMSTGEALFRSYITDDLETFSAEYGVWLKKICQPEERSWRLFGADGPERRRPSAARTVSMACRDAAWLDLASP
jgi:hypothetical protein